MKKLLFIVLLLVACTKESETKVEDVSYCVTCQWALGGGYWSDTLWNETYCADEKTATDYMKHKEATKVYKCFMQKKWN